ncbi:MAG TPA: SRPBCC domain-containing protein [Candidatus Saccharimonadales bacterium]|jgi:uncharacterized protein YndB with AHSA1/START domain|nr:SRPBCC domain-containing protein [Candidatus Saccharimonadales bacterium]
MKQIEKTYTIQAPIAKVWQALTDAKLIEQWGAGPAKMGDTTGGTFSLWGGDIHGTNTKVVPEKLLEQDWYGHDDPSRCYKVSFAFAPLHEDMTTVKLIHADVPDDEAKDFEDGWRDYYFDPIKELLEK